MNNLLFGLWFFLPAGVANVTPIFAAKWKILEMFAVPLDFGKTFWGKRILGNNKTFRGTLIGLVAGIVTAYIQSLLYKQSQLLQNISPIDYTVINPFILGLLLSIGALGGDVAKSFLKRQLGIPGGKTWFPFDQLDYIIGGIVVSMLYLKLSITQYILIAVIWFVIHLISTTVGYLTKLKTSPL